MNYQHILVPIDGSTQSEAALNKAVSMAKESKATITLLNVIDTRSYQETIADDPVLTQDATKRVQEMLDQYLADIEKEGVKAKTRIEYGSPKNCISYEVPESENIDLIMMGATGLSALERLLIGSVSDYVVRHAPCDVMVVRTNLKNQSITLDPQ